MPGSVHPRVLTDEAAIAGLLAGVRRVAVLGMKTPAQADQPAWYVPESLHRAGLEVIPVPVYYPEVTELLGRPVHRRLVDIDGPVDLVDVFRRARDLPGHLDDLLAARPRAVWLQSGIRDDAFALALAQAGITVVQDRCLMVDWRRLGPRLPAA